MGQSTHSFSVLFNGGSRQHGQTKNDKLGKNRGDQQSPVQHLGNINLVYIVIDIHGQKHPEAQPVDNSQAIFVYDSFSSQKNPESQHRKHRQHGRQRDIKTVYSFLSYRISGI